MPSPPGDAGLENEENPGHRARPGTKHHLVTDGGGVPLATIVTGANAHDVTQLLPRISSIPPLRDRHGRPRRRPTAVMGDRAYDSRPHRMALARRRILSLIARRLLDHGSGLVRFRWIFERTIARLHRFRRLRVRFDRRAGIHEGFLSLGCAVVRCKILTLALY